MPWKKIKFIRKFCSPLACIFTCNLFFTVLKCVDKAGLRFYLYLFPFLMANIFILKVFTTVLQTAKKKKRKRKKEFRWRVCYYYFLFRLIFFGCTGQRDFSIFVKLLLQTETKTSKLKDLSSYSAILTSHFVKKVYLQILVI